MRTSSGILSIFFLPLLPVADKELSKKTGLSLDEGFSKQLPYSDIHIFTIILCAVIALMHDLHVEEMIMIYMYKPVYLLVWCGYNYTYPGKEMRSVRVANIICNRDQPVGIA